MTYIAAGLPGPTARFVPLGDLPGDPDQATPVAVSDDGSVVVGNGVSASGPEAFRWTAATGTVGLGDLPGGAFESHATHASRDGLVVVGWSGAAEGRVPFRWTIATGMQRILPTATVADCAPAAATPDADTVVGGCGPFDAGPVGSPGFVWTSARGLEWLLPSPGNVGTPRGVSDDGTVILFGGITDVARLEIGPDGRWGTADDVAHSIVTTDANWGSLGEAHLSADGNVVVYEARPLWGIFGGFAHRWSIGADGLAGTPDDSDDDIGERSGGNARCTPRGLSSDGMVAFGECHSLIAPLTLPYRPYPARWTPGTGWTRLASTPPPGTADGYATAASSDGSVIVGWFGLPFDSVSRFLPGYPCRSFRWTAQAGLSLFGGGADPSDTPQVRVSGSGASVVGPETGARGEGLFLWWAGHGRQHVDELPDGLPFSKVHALSADGRVIVGESSSAEGRRIVRWNEDGSGAVIGKSSRAEWLAWTSANGYTVVTGYPRFTSGAADPAAPPFRWGPPSFTPKRLALPSPYPTCAVEGISRDGTMVAGRCVDGKKLRSFVQSTFFGVRTAPSTPGAFGIDETCRVAQLSTDGSRAALDCDAGPRLRFWRPVSGRVTAVLAGGKFDGMSADGNVILVTAWDPGLPWGRPFLWTPAVGIQILPVPVGASDFSATTLSADGAAVIGIDGPTLYRWRSGVGYDVVARPTGTIDWPNGLLSLSADGRVVAGMDPAPTLPESGNPPPPTRIWISDPLHGGRWLDDVLTANGVDMTGWQLDELVGISDDGTRLAGNGTAPSGQRQGWYAVLPDLAEK